ncbi:MAG: hypothetical protein V3U87_10775 [Methylococcaceae bacterium]
MYRIIKGLFLITLFVATFSVNAGVVCRNPEGIAGFDLAAKRAKLFLPVDTKRIEDTKVYIEKDIDGYYYYHSNYISEGEDNNISTKIARFPELNDAYFGLQNIIFLKQNPSEKEIDNFTQNYDKIELILDESVFEKDGTTNLDFSEFKNIRVANRSDSQALQTLLFTKSLESQKVLVQAGKCCLYTKPRIPYKSIISALSIKTYSPRKTKFLSLIVDSSTEKAITNSQLNIINIKPTAELLSQVKQQLSQMSGETLIILGHVEKSSYVVRNSTGNKIAELPISELRRLANLNKVQLIDVGCNTAGVSSRNSEGIGIAARFNSLQAVELISAAHLSSKNYADFLYKMSSKETPVVIDARVFENVDIQTEVYSKSIWGELSPEPVGTISISLGGSLTQDSLQDDDSRKLERINPHKQIEEYKSQKKEIDRWLEALKGME